LLAPLVDPSLHILLHTFRRDVIGLSNCQGYNRQRWVLAATGRELAAVRDEQVLDVVALIPFIEHAGLGIIAHPACAHFVNAIPWRIKPVGFRNQIPAGGVENIFQRIGGVLGQGVAWESPLGGASTEDLAQFFCNPVFCNRGYNVEAGLVQGTDGNFYGVSANGGTGAFGTGQFAGSVFQIDSTGTVTTLYSFCSLSDCSDGQDPTGALVQGADGNFYGTTTFGGNGTFCGTYTSIPSTLGCGTVFEITPSGTLTTLYSFCSQSNCADGIFPGAGLIQATDGNFYGTTTVSFGSSICSDLSCGTIFQITPAGTLTTLFSFCSTGGEFGCASGALRLGSNSPLMQATNGDFYGTTTQGGSGINNGTVFSLSVGLGPFVETLPNSGQAGTAVKILGTDLTGATGVRFNDTAAEFTVVSSSEITTTVPSGATTGEVEVVTQSGTLSSNMSFRVP